MADIERSEILQIFEDTKDAVEAVQAAIEATLDVQLTGSIEEHMWVDGDAEPTPTATRAIGLVFDPGTDDVTVKIWTGAAWEVM
jgi:hypothetical protein